MSVANVADTFTRVTLDSVAVVGKCPAPFSDPITVKVILEVTGRPPERPIDVKFTWKPIWDFPVNQELDEFEVGPLASVGKHELLLQSDPPDVTKIPDPTGPTALTIAFSYGGKQFLHIGYNAIITCEGEIPDVFEDASMLSRQLTQCFRKEMTVVWDNEIGGNANDEGAKKEGGGEGEATHNGQNATGSYGNEREEGNEDRETDIGGENGNISPPKKRTRSEQQEKEGEAVGGEHRRC